MTPKIVVRRLWSNTTKYCWYVTRQDTGEEAWGATRDGAVCELVWREWRHRLLPNDSKTIKITITILQLGEQCDPRYLPKGISRDEALALARKGRDLWGEIAACFGVGHCTMRVPDWDVAY